MCDTTITPDVQGVDKLPATGKLFIEGKNRPMFVATDAESVEGQLNDVSRVAIQVVNLNGEMTALPRERVVSFVRVDGETPTRVEVQGNPLWGKGIYVHGTTKDEDSELGLLLEDTGVRNDCVTVAGEDLARETLLIIRVPTGQIEWANPSLPDRAKRRLIKLARLAVEAQQLEDDEAAATEALGLTGAGLSEDERNAIAHLDGGGEGNVPTAITMTNDEFVEAYLGRRLRLRPSTR